MEKQAIKDLSDEILNAVEKEKVIAFCEDEVAFEAVKKYVLAVAAQHGTFKEGVPFKGNTNFAFNLSWPATQGQANISDEALGQNLRALTYAVQLVESGFQEIADMQKVEEVSETKENPAE